MNIVEKTPVAILVGRVATKRACSFCGSPAIQLIEAAREDAANDVHNHRPAICVPCIRLCAQLIQKEEG